MIRSAGIPLAAIKSKEKIAPAFDIVRQGLYFLGRRMNRVFTIAIVFIVGIAIIGCESEQHKEQVAADMKRLDDTVKGVQADEQWKLDDETATHVFENDTNSVDNYMKFRKCHEEPPTTEANRKVCAALQQRVARAEAKAKALDKREKANWWVSATKAQPPAALT